MVLATQNAVLQLTEVKSREQFQMQEYLRSNKIAVNGGWYFFIGSTLAQQSL